MLLPSFAGDGRPVAELGGPDLQTGLGQRQRVGDDPLVGHDLVVGHPARQFEHLAEIVEGAVAGDGREVDEGQRWTLPMVELDDEIGPARDHTGVGTGGPQAYRLFPGGGAQQGPQLVG